MNWTRREVVVTGMGAVSSFGIGVGPLWNGIGAGQRGIDSIEDLLALDPAIWPTRDAGAVKYSSVGDHLKRHCEVRNEKSVQIGLVAAREALAQAGLLAQTDIAIPDANPIALVAGSGHGILYPRTSVRSAGETCKVDVQLAVEQPIDSFRANWTNLVIASACSSGTLAIGLAAILIRNGFVERALCGGANPPLTQAIFTGWTNTRVQPCKQVRQEGAFE